MDPRASPGAARHGAASSGRRSHCALRAVALLCALALGASLATGRGLDFPALDYGAAMRWLAPAPAGPNATALAEAAAWAAAERARRGPAPRVAVQWHGTVRSFAHCFSTQVANVLATSPYPVDLFFQFVSEADGRWLAYFNATLAHTPRYKTFDGRWAAVRDAVRGVGTLTGAEERATLDTKYAEFHRFWLGPPYNMDPSFVDKTVFTQEAADRVDALRTAHARRTGAHYRWVVRLRFDAQVMMNPWHGLYHMLRLEANGTLRHPEEARRVRALEGDAPWTDPLTGAPFAPEDSPPLGAPFRFGRYLWVPRRALLPEDHRLVVPACDSWDGWNDQFGMGSARLMTLYHRRLAPDYPHIRRFVLETHRNLGCEEHLSRTMEFFNVTRATIPFCYKILRMHGLKGYDPARALTEPPQACTNADHRYGHACCSAHCEAYRALAGRLRADDAEEDLLAFGAEQPCEHGPGGPSPVQRGSAGARVVELGADLPRGVQCG